MPSSVDQQRVMETCRLFKMALESYVQQNPMIDQQTASVEFVNSISIKNK